MAWSWYSGTLAFLRQDPLFLVCVQDSELLCFFFCLFIFYKGKKKKIYIIDTNRLHIVDQHKTKKGKQDKTVQSQSSESSTRKIILWRSCVALIFKLEAFVLLFFFYFISIFYPHSHDSISPFFIFLNSRKIVNCQWSCRKKKTMSEMNVE